MWESIVWKYTKECKSVSVILMWVLFPLSQSTTNRFTTSFSTRKPVWWALGGVPPVLGMSHYRLRLLFPHLVSSVWVRCYKACVFSTSTTFSSRWNNGIQEALICHWTGLVFIPPPRHLVITLFLQWWCTYLEAAPKIQVMGSIVMFWTCDLQGINLHILLALKTQIQLRTFYLLL